MLVETRWNEYRAASKLESWPFKVLLSEAISSEAIPDHLFVYSRPTPAFNFSWGGLSIHLSLSLSLFPRVSRIFADNPAARILSTLVNSPTSRLLSYFLPRSIRRALHNGRLDRFLSRAVAAAERETGKTLARIFEYCCSVKRKFLTTNFYTIFLFFLSF